MISSIAPQPPANVTDVMYGAHLQFKVKKITLNVLGYEDYVALLHHQYLG